MTKEEAGELILNGDQWVWCQRCLGFGRSGTVLVSVEGEGPAGSQDRFDTKLNKPCTSCCGYGQVLELSCAEAYELLSQPRPRPRGTPKPVILYLNRYLKNVYVTSNEPFTFRFSVETANWVGVFIPTNDGKAFCAGWSDRYER